MAASYSSKGQKRKGERSRLVADEEISTLLERRG
jgi:hypothetical protein